MVSAIAVLKGDSKVEPCSRKATIRRRSYSFCAPLQVSGIVKFSQQDENSPVTVSGEISGNDANVCRLDLCLVEVPG